MKLHKRKLICTHQSCVGPWDTDSEMEINMQGFHQGRLGTAPVDGRGGNRIGQREMLAVMKSPCKFQGTHGGALELGWPSRVVLSWGRGLGL